MKLNRYRLGDFIELYSERCNISNLTIYQVSGINKDKEFFEPSKQVGEDTSNYKIVPPNYFACNLMHVGRDIVLPVSMNHTNINKYVSPAYSVFKIVNEDIILKDYFFMLLKSDEKDRFFWFNTDSSVRDGMSWNDFCSLEIELPSLEIQQKYVDTYKSMVENQKSYEKGLDDLKLVCDEFIDSKISRDNYHKLGNYIKLNNKRNTTRKYDEKNIMGFNDVGDFIKPMRVFSGDISKFRIISKGDFVYNPRIPTIIYPIALNNSNKSILVSPAYVTFNIIDRNKLIEDYLIMILQRKKFSKKVLFNTWGSSTPYLRHEDLCDIEIPVPNLEVQESLALIYKIYNARRIINEKLKDKIKEICPILIKGSIEEAKLS